MGRNGGPAQKHGVPVAVRAHGKDVPWDCADQQRGKVRAGWPGCRDL